MTRLLLAFILAGIFVLEVAAQIPLVPAIPVQETQIPVFTGFKPAEAVQNMEHAKALANFRLHLEYRLPKEASKLAVRLHAGHIVSLPAKPSTEWQKLDLQYEHLPGKAASWSARVNGSPAAEGEIHPELAGAGSDLNRILLGSDFTAMVRFTSTGDGSLFSKCRTEKWEPDAKMLGLRGGRLFYDIGWLGVVTGKTSGLNDGRPHTAVLRVENARATLFIDGAKDTFREKLTRPDRDKHEFHVGLGSKGFDGDLKDGSVQQVCWWGRALSDEEARQLGSGHLEAVNTPDVNWKPEPAMATFPKGIPGLPTKIGLIAGGGAEVRGAWVQPLVAEDHAKLIGRWSEESLAEGGKIYHTLCMTCHGTLTQEGSMPTSRHFQRDPFKNGNDPFRMYQTLTQGYGLMMPLPQYTAEQKYALIHYIRETFLAAANKAGLFAVHESYLDSLPLAMRTLPKQAAPKDDSNQYEKMNFGPMMEWTFQVAPENIAYKGIAVRLDAGDGGVTKGRAWMVYDHDTMRVATATTGSFIDWRGVALDGSHGTHASLTGERLFTLPVGPGWANPENGSWEDPRLRGRDGRPYGPLPRAWAQYKGSYLHGSRVVQSYAIGDAAILDAPEMLDYGKTPLFIRTLNVGKSSRELKLRVAPEPDEVQIRVVGGDASLKLVTEEGIQILTIPAASTPVQFRIAMTKGTDAGSLDALVQHAQLPLDLSTLTHGGPPRWNEIVKTQGVQGADDGPFATDIITHPESGANPWQSWMRLSGFDFFADGARAAVCTWMGDVWIVEGLAQQPLGELKWRRVATGLFQPLGLKIVKETIFVTCRDQIAKLHDLNGDGEIDFIECFNNDQQVTEHFHEFAMGLQTDAEGNFYYAKSACHAKPAVVPQHGTLLRVSADGSRTDILASGFRAANGVCLNPDGTFFVTDQEGHWTPKNRINLVHGKGPSEFFGNMMGYTGNKDESSAAMQQPLCWVTNTFDRSPSELVWVPKSAAWGPLNGALLNLSYGYGKIYTVPFEEVAGGLHQGGLCALPMPQFPTGVMRGRFHPKDGQFYGCGMFAWAGNQPQPGGFYRVRYTGKPALQPLGLHFEKGMIRIDFSDALDAGSVGDASRYAVKVWNLRRSKDYGSAHVDERALTVEQAEVLDGTSLRLHIPELEPTMGIEILCRLKQADGSEAERMIHGTIHRL